LLPLALPSAAWKLVPMGFTTASIVAEQRAELIKVRTGCKELDNILEGTLEGGSMLRMPFVIHL
jgi:DNA repair protein RAD51